MKKLNLLLLLMVPLFCFSQKIRVFVLAGQSNMNGFGFIKDLPSDLKTFNDVYIFQGKAVADNETGGGIGKWEVLKPGHGHQFTTDGKLNKLSDRFGPELSFAKRLKELYPKDKIALIKYAKEGTSIDSLARGPFGSWDSDYFGKTGGNQFKHYLQTVQNALTKIDFQKNEEVVMSGIIWMQGEGDASFTEEIAQNYYNHLTILFKGFRASLRDADAPVVIGKISDSGKDPSGRVWKTGELVQYAQEKFVAQDKNAGIVRTTKNYGYGDDPWHYNSAGYIDLGKNFADEVYKLLQKKEVLVGK